MDENGPIRVCGDITLRLPGPLLGKGAPAHGSMIAEFKLNADVSRLAPYINAVARDAVLYEKPAYIKFVLDGFLCALHGREGAAAAFSARSEALGFMDRLTAFLNDIRSRMNSIPPNHKRRRPVSVLDLYRLLPRTNCRECGFPACMAFAAALSRGETVSSKCPRFSRPIALNAVYPVLDGKGNFISTVTLEVDAAEPSSQWPAGKGDFGGLRESGAADAPGARSGAGASRGGRCAAGSTGVAPAGLTARELAVLRLVAGGATNVEISDVLGISPHTVKSHVIHIFNKLAVNDRTQAAVWAARHNLV